MSTTEDRSAGGLDRVFAKGLAWTAGAKWMTQGITWVTTLIVSRLLTPGDYGIGEIAGIFMMLANVLAEFGLGTAVLHMPELSKKALAQLNLFSCMLGAGIFTLACLAVPAVAAFFHTDHLLVFVVDNLTLVITGFQSVPMGLLQRELNYRRLSIAEAAMVLVQATCTLVLAWKGFGYWALVWGMVAGKVAGAIVVCSWKPVGFAWPNLRELGRPLKMGREGAISRVAWALYTQADVIVVGRFLGESTLGTYRMAITLAAAPAEKVSSLLMRTAGPMFANVKDDRPMVRRYYVLLTEFLSLAILPLMTGLAMLSPVAVQVIFGPKWAAAATPLFWLALFMVVRSLATLTEQVLVSQMRTGLLMKYSMMTLVLMPIAFSIAAVKFGSGGVAAAWLACAPFTVVPLVFILLREIELPAGEYLKSLLPSVSGSAVMCGGLALLATRLPANWPAGLTLAVSVVFGAVVYSAVVWFGFGERVKRYTRFFASFRKPGTQPG